MTKTVLPVKDICLIGVFTALNCVLAQISIPLPFTPIPLSFGVVAVYLAGIMLRPRCAFLSQLCYLLLGSVGLPVFHNFQGGIGALFGPTGGYLFVYPFMALLISLALNRKNVLPPDSGYARARLVLRTYTALSAAILLCYGCGSLWLGATTNTAFSQALALGAYPFIPMDALKISLCAIGLLPIRERLARANLLA